MLQRHQPHRRPGRPGGGDIGIPATAETKQSINKALVGTMKKGAILINTARKEVINEPKLIELMAERT
ncbi:MAG: hypothetical protein J6P56_01040, partial [Bacteroidales bacterium]|nr:hypothetical protein [Bacteroidales bacterium]